MSGAIHIKSKSIRLPKYEQNKDSYNKHDKIERRKKMPSTLYKEVKVTKEYREVEK